jgi:hypothetical protein
MSFYNVLPYLLNGLSARNDFREKRHLEDQTFLVNANETTVICVPLQPHEILQEKLALVQA